MARTRAVLQKLTGEHDGREVPPPTRPWMFLSSLIKIKSGSLYQITALFATEPVVLPGSGGR